MNQFALQSVEGKAVSRFSVQLFVRQHFSSQIEHPLHVEIVMASTLLIDFGDWIGSFSPVKL